MQKSSIRARTAKARIKAVRRHLKVRNQRKDFAVKLARWMVMSADLVALEDLQVRNRHLAKSIHDAAVWNVHFDALITYKSQPPPSWKGIGLRSVTLTKV